PSCSALLRGLGALTLDGCGVLRALAEQAALGLLRLPLDLAVLALDLLGPLGLRSHGGLTIERSDLVPQHLGLGVEACLLDGVLSGPSLVGHPSPLLGKLLPKLLDHGSLLLHVLVGHCLCHRDSSYRRVCSDSTYTSVTQRYVNDPLICWLRKS